METLGEVRLFHGEKGLQVGVKEEIQRSFMSSDYICLNFLLMKMDS